jgi:hypothetical protein
MHYLGNQRLSDREAFFNEWAQTAVSGLDKGRLASNRPLTFQGYPAREVSFTFDVGLSYGLATHKYIIVDRGNRIYTFRAIWSDDKPQPDDAKRFFESIRFIPAVDDVHGRSQAFLEATIRYYWLRDQYPQTVYLSPALRRIADPKRRSESALVKGYGHMLKIGFSRLQNGYRVFRSQHVGGAVVEWFIQDDGNQITAITWKKL